MAVMSSGEIAYYNSLRYTTPAATAQQQSNMARYQILTLTETPQQKYQRESRGDADPNYQANEAARIASFNARGPAEIAARSGAIARFESNPSFGTQAHIDYGRNLSIATQATLSFIQELTPAQQEQVNRAKQSISEQQNANIAASIAKQAKDKADKEAAAEAKRAADAAYRTSQLIAQDEAQIRALGLIPSASALANSAGLLNHGTSNAESAIDVALLTSRAAGTALANILSNTKASEAARVTPAVSKPFISSATFTAGLDRAANIKGQAALTAAAQAAAGVAGLSDADTKTLMNTVASAIAKPKSTKALAKPAPKRPAKLKPPSRPKGRR
jgi:hypothetical protein